MTPITASVCDGRIHLRTPFELKDLCRSITGAKWDKDAKRWTYPASPHIAREIVDRFIGNRVSAEPDFERLVAESASMETAQESKTEETLPEIPGPDDAIPSWLHQRRAFHFAKNLPSAMLGMWMRAGKSRVAVALCNEWQARTVLILCPVKAVRIWPAQFEQYSRDGYDVRQFVDGHTGKRAKAIKQQVDVARAAGRKLVVVLNHEAAWRDALGRLLLKTEWDVVIVDESQRGKMHNGRFSMFLRALHASARRRLALTGTPMPHSPLDIFAQYRFLDPGIYGTSFNRFKMRYAIMGGYLGKEVMGFDNQDELKEKMDRIGFFLTKEQLDKAIDAPEEMDIRQPVVMPPTALEAYRRLEKDFYVKVETGEITAANALVQLLRLQQMTSGFVRVDDGQSDEHLGDWKKDALMDVLRDLEPPVVVCARFKHDLSIVSACAEALGWEHGEISGARSDLTEDGKMPSSVDLMGVQIQSGGVAIDLTRARVMVMLSCGFSLGDYQQMRERLRGTHQKHKTTYIHLVVEGTVDEYVYEALQRREDVVRSILEREAWG